MRFKSKRNKNSTVMQKGETMQELKLSSANFCASKKQVLQLFSENLRDAAQKEMLAKSLYYYCAGCDPTPVLAFGAQIPLYIYVDTLRTAPSFADATGKLYDRLQGTFELIETVTIPTPNLRGAQNVTLTVWNDVERGAFYLLFIQQDAEEAFRVLYAEDTNFIMPACVCNIKYECTKGILDTVEKRVRYVLGHCFSDKYKVVDRAPYHGDYNVSGTPEVELWERMYYCLF